MSETTTADATATATEAAAETATDSTVTDSTTAETQAVETAPTKGEDALGDAGKKALDAMKAKWKESEKTAKEQAAALAALQAKLDGKEAEHAATEAAQKVKDDALAAANERILKAHTRTAAKGRVADDLLTQAVNMLDLDSIEVSEDGEPDEAAVTAALDALLVKYPSLAAQGGPRFTGSADGGARNGATQASQLSKSDVERLYADKKYAEIERARSEGRLTKVLGG